MDFIGNLKSLVGNVVRSESFLRRYWKTEPIDQVYIKLARVYSYDYQNPLHRLKMDIATLENQGKSKEQALLELAMSLKLKPYEILRLERDGKSTEDAVSEFLKGAKLSLNEDSPEAKGAITGVTHEKIYSPSPSSASRYSEPTKLWYLAPLFLSLVGGLIGYVAVKDEDKGFADNLLVLGFLVFFFNIIIIWWLFMTAF